MIFANCCRKAGWNLLVLLTALPAAGMAAEAGVYSTGQETWTVNSGSMSLQTPDWPIKEVLAIDIQVDESHLNFKKDEAQDSPEDPFKAAPPARTKTESKPGQETPPPKFEFKSDRTETSLLVVKSGDKSQVVGVVQRHFKFDASRRSVLVLDVVSGSPATEKEVSITYQTTWSPEAVPRLAQPREFFSEGPSKQSVGVLVATSGEPKLPLLMFIAGTPRANWKRTVKATEGGLSWTYKGSIPEKGHAMFLHCLTLTEDASTTTIRQALSQHLEGGMPAGLTGDEQVLAQLINYPVEVAPAAPPPPNELFFIKALASRLKIERSRETDHLVLDAATVLKGRLQIEGLRLKAEDGGKERSLAAGAVAAIQGGAGAGRTARVFLRDGTVASGVLSWKTATFKSETLGTMNLKPESLDQVILRVTDDDGRMASAPAGLLAVEAGGDVLALDKLPAKPVRLRWIGGELLAPWENVASLRQLPAPALEYLVVLKDGSRIEAWLDLAASGIPAPSCLAFSTTWAGLMKMLGGMPGAVENTPELNLETTDHSLLAGAWAEQTLQIVTSAAPVSVPVADIRRLAFIPGGDETPALLEITTADKTQLRGQPVMPMLAWNHGGRTLMLPWSLVKGVSRAEPPAKAEDKK